MALAWAASPRSLIRYSLLGMMSATMTPFAVFLGAVAAGAPLEKALAEAEAAAPGFDLAAALAAGLSRGVFGAEVSFDPTLNGGVA